MTNVQGNPKSDLSSVVPPARDGGWKGRARLQNLKQIVSEGRHFRSLMVTFSHFWREAKSNDW